MSSRLIYPPKRLFFDPTLYLIANRPSFQDEHLFFSKVMQAVKGGVTCVQYRDHESDPINILKTAALLRTMLKDVALFINTLKCFEVAQVVGADGVYLEEPFSYSEARKILGQKQIIGIPARSVSDVLALGQTTDVDYLSVKIGLSTRTCTKNYQIIEMEEVQKMCAASPYKIVLTGGQNLSTVKVLSPELRGVVGHAMASGLMMAADVERTAQEIREAL